MHTRTHTHTHTHTHIGDLRAQVEAPHLEVQTQVVFKKVPNVLEVALHSMS
jgi:hypothetical protein